MKQLLPSFAPLFEHSLIAQRPSPAAAAAEAVIPALEDLILDPIAAGTFHLLQKTPPQVKQISVNSGRPPVSHVGKEGKHLPDGISRSLRLVEREAMYIQDCGW